MGFLDRAFVGLGAAMSQPDGVSKPGSDSRFIFYVVGLLLLLVAITILLTSPGSTAHDDNHAIIQDKNEEMAFAASKSMRKGDDKDYCQQIADLPVPVAESPGAVRIGHPERSHLVEYLAPNSVFNSLPRQRSSPHLRPDDRLVTIDRVLHHASLGVA